LHRVPYNYSSDQTKDNIFPTYIDNFRVQLTVAIGKTGQFFNMNALLQGLLKSSFVNFMKETFMKTVLRKFVDHWKMRHLLLSDFSRTLK